MDFKEFRESRAASEFYGRFFSSDKTFCITVVAIL